MNNIKQITNFDLSNVGEVIKQIRKGGTGNLINYPYKVITSEILESDNIVKFGYCTNSYIGMNYPIFLVLDGKETEFQLGKTGMFEFQPEKWKDVNTSGEEEVAQVSLSEVLVPVNIPFVIDYIYATNESSSTGTKYGKSAYDLAVENGYAGTVNQWLNSLKGKNGTTPVRGVDYMNDTDLKAIDEQVDTSVSDYFTEHQKDIQNQIEQIAKLANVKVDADAISDAIEDYLIEHPIENLDNEAIQAIVSAYINDNKETLRGEQGPRGSIGPQGPKGESGKEGPAGRDGKSAFEIAQDEGFVGTEIEWLNSLKGKDGSPVDGEQLSQTISSYLEEHKDEFKNENNLTEFTNADLEAMW